MAFRTYTRGKVAYRRAINLSMEPPAMFKTRIDPTLVDPDATLPGGLARTLQYVSQIAPAFSLRGGTREVLRGMIARGSRLPSWGRDSRPAHSPASTRAFC